MFFLLVNETTVGIHSYWGLLLQKNSVTNRVTTLTYRVTVRFSASENWIYAIPPTVSTAKIMPIPTNFSKSSFIFKKNG
jgi:hypothetical protein